jgi:peptidoglycan/xylan/chitin deacetylase (PgdA/CDA1 family)
MRPLRRIREAARAYWWDATHETFLIVLNWHQVTPQFDPTRHHRYTWTQLEAFKENVAYLSRNFRILPLHEAMQRLSAGTLKGRCVALSFDDGDASIAEYVVPFLRSAGVPATFFVNTAYRKAPLAYWFPILSYLSANNGHCPDFTPELKKQAEQLRHTKDPVLYNDVRLKLEALADAVPYLENRLVTEEWIATLDGEQFAIGAHGHEHQRFSMMSPAWQRENLQKNLELLREFRAYRPIFAVPFGRSGDFTEDTLLIARELGLGVVLADGGINLKSEDCLKRVPSDGGVIRRTLAAAMSRAE